MSTMSNRRYVITLIVSAFAFAFLFIGFFRSQRDPGTLNTMLGLDDLGDPVLAYQNSLSNPLPAPVHESLLKGPVVASKLGNETVKAELGRAAWKLFHTTLARFPDNPSADESESLRVYLHLFQRLYPCGECAEHFASIINKYPPQTKTRSTAAAWGCHVHNEVNKSLKKDIFDCSKIGDFYDCGCADDEDASSARPTHVATENVALDEREPVLLDKEDLQRGG